MNIVATYKDHIIYEANRYNNYGAWFSFCDYAFTHKSQDSEKYYYLDGFAKTIEDCKTEIDDLYELHDYTYYACSDEPCEDCKELKDENGKCNC